MKGTNLVCSSNFRSFCLALVLLLGLALRLMPWGQNRFLEDEALYGYWGLQIATGADPMLDQEPVDKPPLQPYILALSFLALGPTETAARLPSLLASMAGIALVYALARALYADAVLGLLAALLLALSPFDLLFASTAFTDPLLTAWVLAALLAAARGRHGAAGLLAGLAAATKQQGLFFLPLVAAVLALALTRLPKFRPQDRNRSAHADSPESPELLLNQETLEVFDPEQRRLPRHRAAPSEPPQRRLPRRRTCGIWRSRASEWLNRPWLRFGLAFLAVAAAVIAWDLARVQRPGFLAQSLISYGGLGPAQPQALGPRAVAWLELLLGFWGGALPVLLAVALLGLLLAAWARRGRATALHWTRVDGLLAGFLAAFLLFHWLVGFQVWDRYLLGLVPLAALLAARLLLAAVRLVPIGRWRAAAATALALLLLATLAQPVALAASSELPLGGDHGAYDGIDQLAAFLRVEALPGAVVYHYWLGYHYRFYLHGAPLRLHWYPDPADLVHDATVYRREARYIAFPSFRDGSQARAALTAAGIKLLPVYEAHRRDGSVSFRLYRMEGPG